MATITGTSGADTRTGSNEADTIYGYDPSSPTATQVGTEMFQTVFATAPAGDANRLFIAEKGVMQRDANGNEIGTALVKVVDLQNPTAAATTILTLSPMSSGNETGLLGLALHPEFAVEGSPHRGKLYVNYTASIESGGDQVIVEYTFNPGNLAAGPTAPPKTIMTIDYTTSNHRAGWMEFGPDGKLYIATGEDQNANNSQTIMQDGSVNLKGKILRIDVNGDSFPGDANNNYGIPADNPDSFVNINGTFAPSAIWAVGLRNPWRCSFDKDGKLYIADVGETAWEEINIGEAGANYGWRAKGDGQNADGPQGAGHTDPVYAYQHNVMGRSITGGYVYEGPGDFNGHYIFGDYGNGQIFAIDLRVKNPTAVNITSRIAFPNNTSVGAWNLVSFGQDGQGNLYVLGRNGRVLKLDLSGSTTDLGDSLAGDDGDDIIYGGAGNDTISGDAGADRLDGGADSDIYYVDGDDTVIESTADAGQDEIRATESFTLEAGQAVETLRAWPADSETPIDLTGNELAQRLIGNAGENVLNGGGGADTLMGGAGNDTYVVDGNDDVGETNDDGSDTGGIDTVRTALNNYTLGTNLEKLILDGTAAINGSGNELANTITGNSAANSLSGAEGVDTLIGGNGADTLDGGDGADRLEGGSGNDTYQIDNSNDVIVEGTSGGVDTLITSASYVLRNNASVEILKAAAGTDVINVTGNNLANTLHGNRGINVLDGGADENGDDVAVFTGRRTDYTITRNQNGSFKLQDSRANADGTDTVFNVEIFKFSDGSVTAENLLNKAPTGITLDFDVVAENSKAKTPIGTFKATDEDDTQHRFELVDDAGGRFAIDRSTGALTVADGVRLDYEQATRHSITVKVTDGADASFTRTLFITVDNVLNESATGDALGNLILGGNGQDTFWGGLGNDTINSGAGNDRLNGDAGNDSLVGGAGNDVFSGGDGNDPLVGGSGKDTFTGGKGRDVFVFDDRDTGSSKTKADYIIDFKGREGDRLDLKLIDANTKKRGDQKFSFIGKDDAFSKAGEVRFEKTKSATYVYLNTDNDRAAEAVIKLKGSIELSKSWFVL